MENFDIEQTHKTKGEHLLFKLLETRNGSFILKLSSKIMSLFKYNMNIG